MKPSLLLFASVALLLALNPRASASASFPVTIEVPTVFDQTEQTFTASGEAVERGLICESGTVTEGKYIAAGHWEGPKGAHWNFRIEKVFQCVDESGSFTINLKAHLFFEPYSDVGTWNILRGDGDYSNLHGNGSLEGFPFEGGVRDVYTGSVHTD